MSMREILEASHILLGEKDTLIGIAGRKASAAEKRADDCELLLSKALAMAGRMDRILQERQRFTKEEVADVRALFNDLLKMKYHGGR